VLTTKHHDGYTLWPSEHAVLGTHTHLSGRDLLEPYVEACRNCGLKVGLYFSFADWAWPGFPIGDVDFNHNWRGHHPSITDEEDEAQFETFYQHVCGQLAELLGRYGGIDLLWFDGVKWRDRDGAGLRAVETIDWLRSLQPHLLVNNRWGQVGDFLSAECKFPESPPGTWWELCQITNGHWGYNPGKPLPEVSWWTDKLERCRAWGGSFLVNVGPAPDGTMPDDFYERCEALSRRR